MKPTYIAIALLLVVLVGPKLWHAVQPSPLVNCTQVRQGTGPFGNDEVLNSCSFPVVAKTCHLSVIGGPISPEKCFDSRLFNPGDPFGTVVGSNAGIFQQAVFPSQVVVFGCRVGWVPDITDLDSHRYSCVDPN